MRKYKKGTNRTTREKAETRTTKKTKRREYSKNY
jgi:hypothetical protein